MSYHFSIVRFVPDPAKGEFINVAAIAGSDVEESWEIRAVGNWKRAKMLDEHGTISAAIQFITELQSRVDGGPGVDGSGMSLASLEQLSNELCNVVQVTSPVPLVATSASAALDLVFDELIVDPERLRFPFAKKTRAVAALKKAYLARSVPMFRQPRVHAGPYDTMFDFAVANGKAVQLVRCWSFQLPDQGDLAEQVKAWAWAVRAMRRAGNAQALMENGSEYLIAPDIDVEAIFVPPATGQKDTSAYDVAMDAFQDQDTHIAALTDDHADDTARKAVALLSHP